MARNYFLFLRFEGDYITPSTAQRFQNTTIPAGLYLLNTLYGWDETKIQKDAYQLLLSEIGLLSQISAQAVSKSKEIPVVYEGFQLLNDEDSMVVELLDVLLEMIDDATKDDPLSTQYSELITELKGTREVIEYVSKSPELWADLRSRFKLQGTNSPRIAL